MSSPLSQFDVISLLIVVVWKFDLSITNLVLTLFLVFGGFALFFFLLKKKFSFIPTRFQRMFELVFLFCYNLVRSQLGYKGLIYFPFIFTLFMFLLLLNLAGLVPYSFAATSHFVWTLYFSLSISLGIFGLGVYNHGIKFFKIFLPEVPFVLYPLLMLIEMISYIIRSFSLAIRLSANILAGHILLHLMADVAYFLSYNFFDISLFFVVLLFCLFLLEVGVAMLQAYIFTLLVCIYLNDAVNFVLH